LPINDKLRGCLLSKTGKVFIIGVSSRILIFATAILGSLIFGPTHVTSTTSFINLFSNWDSKWYSQIALSGYPTGTNPLSETWAFFPLYPILMRLFGTPFFGFTSPTQAVLISGFLISNILFFTSLFLFYKITQTIFDNNRICLLSTVFFAFLPGALFYSCVYSESLFMTLTLGAFYLLEKNQSAKAGILGFLASLTKSNGFLIMIPFIYKGLQNRKYRTAIYQTILIATPYLLFSTYGYALTGLFPVREIVYNRLWGATRFTLTEIGSYQLGYATLASAEAILLLIPFAWFIFREEITIKALIKGSNPRRDLKYWALSFWILFMIVFYTDPKSLHRYILPILPMYWVYAMIWEKSSKIGKALLGVIVVILIIGTILFTQGEPYL
jgi:hypothetical protein